MIIETLAIILYLLICIEIGWIIGDILINRRRLFTLNNAKGSK